MRHLRDKLMVAFVPLIVLLIGATYAVQRGVVEQLSAALKEQLSRSQVTLEALNESNAGRLAAQVEQINESANFKVILRDYVNEKRKRADAQSNGKASASGRQSLDDFEASIRMDVAPTEARRAHLDLLAIVDLDGRLVASIRKNGETYVDCTAEDGATPVARDPLVRTALQKAQEGRRGSWRSFLIWPDGKLYMAAASTLIIDDYVEGALIAGTRHLLISSTSDVIFVANRRVLEAPAFIDPAARWEIEQALASWEPPKVAPPWEKAGDAPYVPASMPMTIGGKPYYAAPCPLFEFGRDPPLAWAFFVQPLDKLLGKAIEARSTVVKMGAMILVLSILAILLLARRITRPIETLRDKMYRVGEGKLDQQAAVVGRDEVAQLARSFNDMVDGLREKERLAAYVPEKARDAIAHVKGRHALGAKRVKASILFSDLRGFTTLSEKLDPSEVVALLNEYLEHMQRIISEHDGYISDYVGDAIMAVFSEDRHGPGSSSLLAVGAAERMQQDLARLRQTSKNPNLQGLRMGIGVNTGYLVEGDIGPRARLKYAVLGDVVNTAARIQDRSKEGRHTCILVSGATYEEVRSEFEATFFGDELLKGKSMPVPIWEVMGRRASVTSASSTPESTLEET